MNQKNYIQANYNPEQILSHYYSRSIQGNLLRNYDFDPRSASRFFEQSFRQGKGVESLESFLNLFSFEELDILLCISESYDFSKGTNIATDIDLIQDLLSDPNKPGFTNPYTESWIDFIIVFYDKIMEVAPYMIRKKKIQRLSVALDIFTNKLELFTKS